MKFWLLLPVLMFPFGELGAQVQTGPRFVVSTLTDRNNAVAMTDDCSLREAIRAATATGQPAIIVFSEKLTGTLTLSPSFGALSLSTPVSLLGPGARKISVGGGGAVRVFRVSGGPHLIAGLTIKDGKVTASNDGGAGISNSGTLVLQDCAVSGNQTQSPYRFVARGGGILSSGTLTLIRSTVSGNSAKGTDASGSDYGDSAFGGGVHISGGSFTALSCTFYNNTAAGGAGSISSGWACGAIYNQGTAILRNCTVSGNDAKATERPGIGGVFSDGGNCTVFSSIIAANTVTGYARHRDVRGSFTSEGYNFIGAVNGFPYGQYEVGAFSQPTDLAGTEKSQRNPMLAAFQNNGGPTDTMLPQAASPVVDLGKASMDSPDDQRGLKRLVDDPEITDAAGGDGADIGAVELNAPTTIPMIEFTGGQAVLHLIGARGVNHTFEYSDELETWTPFGGTVLSDGAGNLTVIDPFIPGPQPPRRFYRAVPQ